MAETPSTMIALGTQAPEFKLWDACTNQQLSLNELKSSTATVIMFICNHCPYVKLILPKLLEIAKAYQLKGISFIAINSNDAKNYPADAPDKMQAEAKDKQFTFPYLFDETQEVAKAYRAACTPDFYIFDAQLKCVYRGRFDDATPGNGKLPSGNDLTNALDQLLTEKPITQNQQPSVGCNIKWKK